MPPWTLPPELRRRRDEGVPLPGLGRQAILIPFRYKSRQGETRQRPLTERLSALERLPTEVIEKIFLDCYNLNLLAASPYLACKLSSLHIRKSVFLTTCSSDIPYICPLATSTYFPDVKILAQAQDFVVSRKWTDLDFIRGCIPEYLTNSILQEFSMLGLHWLSPEGSLVTPSLREIISEYVNERFSASISESEDGRNNYTEVNWEETEPKREVSLALAPREGLAVVHVIVKPDSRPHDPLEEVHKHHARYRVLGLCRGVRIPDRLLHGPWTDEKCELLDIMVRGNASVDWIHTTSGEIAKAGFWDALRERSAQALHGLTIQYTDMTPGERKDASYSMIPSLKRGVGIVPTQEHLLYAIQSGCREDIMEILLNAPDSPVNLQDQSVTRLLYFMRQQDHPRASWLADRIELDRQRRKIAKELRLVMPSRPGSTGIFPPLLQPQDYDTLYRIAPSRPSRDS